MLRCQRRSHRLRAFAQRARSIRVIKQVSNPVDNLEPLARAGVPLLHVVGDAADVVPVAENTAILEARYKQLGGQITVIHKPGVGHHPH